MVKGLGSIKPGVLSVLYVYLGVFFVCICLACVLFIRVCACVHVVFLVRVFLLVCMCVRVFVFHHCLCIIGGILYATLLCYY